jgi:hypothetical protein
MNKDELKQITGGLSKPSKMPGFSYNLPATRCITGAKLVKIPGSVCSGCYALKGRYRFPNVKNAMQRRLDSINHPLWTQAMATSIIETKTGFFRWHDSGDLQSLDHLKKIFEVCNLTPGIQHWLPTRETSIIACIQADEVPKNLIIRLSAHKVDGKASTFWPWTSTVVTSEKTCPAAEQENKCKDCRACWDRTIPNVAYGKH